jgi:S1-C subfamily serine protease
MSEEEVLAGTPAGQGGRQTDVWDAVDWMPPPPPAWWPQTFYTYEPPPPPRRTSRLRMLLVALVLVIFGASAAATAVIATRGLGGSGNITAVDAAIVDINTTLGGGASAAGTGMVLTPSGEVLTNNHVIFGALSISVQLTSTGASYSARVVGYDLARDVAVLQLAGASGLATIPIGDSSTVQVGDSVTALGNALGRGGAPASAPGTVTALNQSISASDESGTQAPESLAGMIQIDAAIKPGDSGGPLLDSGGKVIGMDTAASGGRQWQQTGAMEAFAIPINTALSVARQIVKSPSGAQTASGGFLGVQVVDSTSPAGALVEGIQPGSPAAATGLGSGDVITSIGGTTVDSVLTLQNILKNHHAGDRVVVTWVTASGQQQRATVTLAAGTPK